MFNIGPLELILIFIVALVVIGPKRLPDLAKALGKAIGEFKRATSELQSSLDAEIKPRKDTFRPSKASGSLVKPSEKDPKQDSKEELITAADKATGTGRPDEPKTEPLKSEENNLNG